MSRGSSEELLQQAAEGLPDLEEMSGKLELDGTLRDWFEIQHCIQADARE